MEEEVRIQGCGVLVMEFDACSRGSSFRELRVEARVTNGNLEPASSVIELRQRFTEACGVPPYLPPKLISPTSLIQALIQALSKVRT
jgi:hypothetical protein